jgi:hypothetical protein
MLRLARNLSRTASRLLNQLFKLCWLVPLRVSDDERILRAIYSPHHYDKKKKRLRHYAYDPTPKTDEVSVMRIEYMGPHCCHREAQSSENLSQRKEYCGFAVLRVSAVRNSAMNVIDSRKHYCGHADIKLLMEEVRNREPNEPLSAEAGKRFKDLKDCLLKASNYVPDPDPRGRRWRGGKLDPPAGT